MRIARLGRSATSRRVVIALCLTVGLFGLSLVPKPRPLLLNRPPAPGIGIPNETIVGQAALEHIEHQLSLVKKESSVRRVHEREMQRLAHLGVSLPNTVVIRPKHSDKESSFFGFLSRTFGSELLADTEKFYGEDGELWLTPFEADNDSDTAEFNAFYWDYGTGFYTSIDISLVSSDMSNYPVSGSNSAIMACNEDSRIEKPSFASLLVPTVHAQTTFQGTSCDNTTGLNEKFYQAHTTFVQNAWIGAGAAAVPCVGATIGWIACVGGAFSGGYIASITWYAGNYLYSCRCRYLGLSCP